MSKAVMQQALKILENGTIALPGWVPDYDDAITSLRAALAEQAQPVACHVFNVTVSGRLHEWEPTTFAFALKDGKHALYTIPPAPIVPPPPFVPQPLTELPPLPEPAGKLYSYNYTADQMRDYARAVEAEVLKRVGVQR